MKKITLILLAVSINYASAQISPFGIAQDEWIMRDLDNVNFNHQRSHKRLDPHILKTVILNGIIDYDFDEVTDMQIGALNAEELSLLRNMLFAKHGYRFRTQKFTNYFRKFDWYEPIYDDVTDRLSRWEKRLIERIKSFESNNFANIREENLIGYWKQYNGGADQEGASLQLNQDGTFKYNFPGYGGYRTTKYWGNWDYDSGKIILEVTNQNIFMGGYFHEHPNTPYIDNYISAEIIFTESIKIELPVLNTDHISSSNEWYKLGCSDFHKN